MAAPIKLIIPNLGDFNDVEVIEVLVEPADRPARAGETLRVTVVTDDPGARVALGDEDGLEPLGPGLEGPEPPLEQCSAPHAVAAGEQRPAAGGAGSKARLPWRNPR